jgi:hypothetical protein
MCLLGLIPIKEATWLSHIVVVLKKNGKSNIYVNFRKLNRATKKKKKV